MVAALKDFLSINSVYIISNMFYFIPQSIDQTQVKIKYISHCMLEDGG